VFGVGVSTARAEALTTVSEQPVAFQIGNPCNGEIVMVTGTIRFVSTFVQTASGVTVSTAF
jgi:hypothetical protein